MVILLPNTFPSLVYMKSYFVLQRVLCLALEYVVAEMDSFATVHKRPDSEIDTHKTYCVTPPPPIGTSKTSFLVLYLPCSDVLETDWYWNWFLDLKRRFFLLNILLPLLLCSTLPTATFCQTQVKRLSAKHRWSKGTSILFGTTRSLTTTWQSTSSGTAS